MVSQLIVANVIPLWGGEHQSAYACTLQNCHSRAVELCLAHSDESEETEGLDDDYFGGHRTACHFDSAVVTSRAIPVQRMEAPPEHNVACIHRGWY